MLWQISADATFYDSLDAFDESDADDVATVVEKLILRILDNPYRVETVGTSSIRVVRQRRLNDRVPALRLLYIVTDDDRVTLLRLECDPRRMR